MGVKIVYCSGMNTSSDVTLESVMRTCRRLMASRSETYDVIVMTTAEFHSFKESLADKLRYEPNPATRALIGGIPVYHYETRFECSFRANEFVRAGKKVMMTVGES